MASTASARWLLVALLFMPIFLISSAGSKETVAHIQCAVCKHTVKEASKYAKDKHIDDEDAMVDLAENLCTGSKDEGKWTTKIDIWRFMGQKGAELGLDFRDEEGVCEEECKAVQKACAVSLKSGEEKLVKLLLDGAGVGKLQREVCKQTCKKTAPALGKWKDEVWKSVDSKPTMPPPPEPPAKVASDPVNEFGPVITDIITGSLEEFGSDPTVDDMNFCYIQSDSSQTTLRFLQEVKQAADEMMEKKLESMRSGLARLFEALKELAEKVKAACGDGKGSVSQMRALAEYAVAQSKQKEVEYEPMKTLRVGGHDLHKLLNSCLGEWKKETADGKAFGQALGRLLKPFAESGSSSGKDKAEL